MITHTTGMNHLKIVDNLSSYIGFLRLNVWLSTTYFFYTVSVEVLTTIAIRTAVTYYATPFGNIPTFRRNMSAGSSEKFVFIYEST